MAASNAHRVLILGSGPAGLTAALYNARANLEPTVVEGTQPGGQLTITTDVENYPGFPDGVLGPDMMELFRKQVTRFGTRFVYGDVTEVDLSKRPFRVKVGPTSTPQRRSSSPPAPAPSCSACRPRRAHGPRRLGLRTCDGFFFKEGARVVGGGDTAMEEASFLTKFATNVHVLHRRDELRASKIMQDRAKRNPKIKFVWNVTIDEILGDARRAASRRRAHGHGHRREAADDAGRRVHRHRPRAQHQLFKGQLAMDERGYLVTEPRSTATSVPACSPQATCRTRRTARRSRPPGAGAWPRSTRALARGPAPPWVGPRARCSPSWRSARSRGGRRLAPGHDRRAEALQPGEGGLDLQGLRVRRPRAQRDDDRRAVHDDHHRSWRQEDLHHDAGAGRLHRAAARRQRRREPARPDAHDATEELVGSEKIDGHPTKKYKMKATVGGKTREHYQWRATDLKNFPIRTAAVDGTYEQRFTKVELKTPDAKLFETPANCKSMPAVGSPTPPPKAAP
jgi:thioredoxin reductase (NADPH)